MWEYRVVSGHYNVDGANVFLKNPAGEGTLQLVLDHYGGERWELVSSSFDNVHRELVLVFKRPRAGAAAAPPAVPAAVFVDPELGAVKRRSPATAATPVPDAAARGGRRSKADLDKLARED